MTKALGLFCLLLLLSAAPARADELRLMTLGDSIVGGGAGNFRTPLKALLAADGHSVTYVGLLRDADGNRHEGHGGWTPAQVRLIFLSTDTADIYVLYAGLNGLDEGSVAPGPDGYGPHVAAMKDILDAAYARNPSARVVLAQIGHIRDASSAQNALISTFNRQLALMVSGYGQPGRLWLANLEDVFADDPSLFADAVHPSQKGYDALAAALHPHVRAAAAAATPFPGALWGLGGGLVGLAVLAGLVVLRKRRQGLAPQAAPE